MKTLTSEMLNMNKIICSILMPKKRSSERRFGKRYNFNHMFSADSVYILKPLLDWYIVNLIMETKTDKVRRYLGFYVYIAVFIGIVQMVNYQMTVKENTNTHTNNITRVENYTKNYDTSINSTSSSVFIYATVRM
jgi:hypothetical protein